MRPLLRTLLFFVAFLSGAVLASPQGFVPVSVPPPAVAGRSYILIDHTSGQVLAEHNADLLAEPASITKVMTAYVAFTALRDGEVSLDDEVLISKRAGYMGGSRMYIDIGKKVKFDDLLHGAIIRSGNDAATAIAEHIGGTVEKFVERMNATAAEIGMVNTRFASPSGLTRNQDFTSARDIATLSSRLIHDFPEHYHLFGERTFRYGKYTLRNRNQLLADDSIDGIKTGFTNGAGFCLTASAAVDQSRFIAVVMGAKSWSIRNRAVQSLLDYAKQNYETVRVYAGGRALVNRPVWKGESQDLGVGLEQDVLVTIPRGQSHQIKARMTVESYLIAPLQAGENLGSLRIEMDGHEIVSRPVVALESVSEGNLWRQMVDTVALWFEPAQQVASATTADQEEGEISRHAAAMVW